MTRITLIGQVEQLDKYVSWKILNYWRSQAFSDSRGEPSPGPSLKPVHRDWWSSHAHTSAELILSCLHGQRGLPVTPVCLLLNLPSCWNNSVTETRRPGSVYIKCTWTAPDGGFTGPSTSSFHYSGLQILQLLKLQPGETCTLWLTELFMLI